MKLVRIALAIIISVLLVGLICPAVQAEDNKAEVELTVTVLPPPPPPGGGGGGGARDTTPPTISDILVSNITKTSADISWKTNEMSDSQVEYWSSPSQFSSLDTERVINHLVHLTDLTPATSYYFKVMSRDAADNLAVSDVYAFTTLPGVAIFAASKLSISPSEVYIGETVAITVLVTNTGDGAGSYKVVLKINGVVEATKDITLNAGASGEVAFTAVKDVAGSYSVAVNGLTGIFVVKAPAAFTISALAISPAKVNIGEDITISALVTNTGDLTGTYEVTLKIDNVVVATESVTLAGGASEKVTFTTSKDVAGTYAVNLNGLSGTFVVKAGLNWPVVGGIIGGVVVVGLGVFFWMRRKAA